MTNNIEIATFNTDKEDFKMKEDYHIDDTIIGDGLTAVIGVQQLQRHDPIIPDEELTEDFMHGFARGKLFMMEACRNWLMYYFDKSSEEIETILRTTGEQPYLDVTIDGESLNEDVE